MFYVRRAHEGVEAIGVILWLRRKVMRDTEGKERKSAEHGRTKAAIEAGDTLLREDAND